MSWGARYGQELRDENGFGSRYQQQLRDEGRAHHGSVSGGGDSIARLQTLYNRRFGSSYTNSLYDSMGDAADDDFAPEVGDHQIDENAQAFPAIPRGVVSQGVHDAAAAAAAAAAANINGGGN